MALETELVIKSIWKMEFPVLGPQLSPIFGPVGYQWRLQVSPSGQKEPVFGLFLCPHDAKGARQVSFKLSIVDRHGNALKRQDIRHTFENVQPYGNPRFIHPEQVSPWLVDGLLYLKVEITDGHLSQHLNTPDCSCHLLYNDRQFADLVIQTRDSPIICHKAVLATNEFFKYLLKTEIDSPGELKKLDLSQYSITTVNAMLEFIYKGNILMWMPQELPNVLELIHLGMYIRSRELPVIACKQVMTMIDPDTVFMVLKYAFVYRYSVLLDASLQFYLRHLPELQQRPDYHWHMEAIQKETPKLMALLLDNRLLDPLQ